MNADHVTPGKFYRLSTAHRGFPKGTLVCWPLFVEYGDDQMRMLAFMDGRLRTILLNDQDQVDPEPVDIVMPDPPKTVRRDMRPGQKFKLNGQDDVFTAVDTSGAMTPNYPDAGYQVDEAGFISWLSLNDEVIPL